MRAAGAEAAAVIERYTLLFAEDPCDFGYVGPVKRDAALRKSKSTSRADGKDSKRAKPKPAKKRRKAVDSEEEEDDDEAYMDSD